MTKPRETKLADRVKRYVELWREIDAAPDDATEDQLEALDPVYDEMEVLWRAMDEVERNKVRKALERYG